MSIHSRISTQNYDFTRPVTQQEPIKTGSILINPDDVLPSLRGSLHTDPRTHESYANLKSWHQIQEEQRGIVHYGTSDTSNAQMPISSYRFEERPMTNTDDRSSRVYSREFNYEYSRNNEQDPVKTGGIVIDPQDARTISRSEIHVDPHSGVTYARLKPWTQIQEQQGGITHSSQLQETGVGRLGDIDRLRSTEISLNREGVTQAAREPVRVGGILIDPEDMLPSRRQELQTQEVGRHSLDRSHYEILHRPQVSHTEQREPKLLSSEPVDIAHIPGAHTTRNIRPEDMLPWMRDVSQDGQVPFAVREREFNYGVSRPSNEPEKIGGIVIRPEDMLPSRRGEFEGKNTVQLHRTAVSSMRQKNSGSGYYELVRAAPEEEPIKTGGIVVDPRDVHAARRSEVYVDPNSHLTVAKLKPWSQIQEEQAGIVHGGSVYSRAPHHTLLNERTTANAGQREFNMEYVRPAEQREPVRGGKGTMLVNREDMRTEGRREFDMEYTRPIEREREPIRGGKGTMLVNREDMRTEGQREFDMDYTRPVEREREPTKGGKGTMLVNREDMRPQAEGEDYGINMDRLNPQTRELLMSYPTHSRTKSMGYGLSSNQFSYPQSYLEVAKPTDYLPKSIDLNVHPTQSTFTDLDSRVESALNRSKNILSVSSLTHLGEHPEPTNWSGSNPSAGQRSYLGAF